MQVSAVQGAQKHECAQQYESEVAVRDPARFQ